MAHRTHSECVLSTGLAIQWSLEEGYPHLRWAKTKQLKPYRPSWVGWAGNWEGTKPLTAIHRAAKNEVWTFCFEFLTKVFCLFRLFL